MENLVVKFLSERQAFESRIEELVTVQEDLEA